MDQGRKISRAVSGPWSIRPQPGGPEQGPDGPMSLGPYGPGRMDLGPYGPVAPVGYRQERLSRRYKMHPNFSPYHHD